MRVNHASLGVAPGMPNLRVVPTPPSAVLYGRRKEYDPPSIVKELIDTLECYNLGIKHDAATALACELASDEKIVPREKVQGLIQDIVNLGPNYSRIVQGVDVRIESINLERVIAHSVFIEDAERQSLQDLCRARVFTSQENRYYLIRYREYASLPATSANQKEMVQIKNLLIKHNMGLVFAIAKRYLYSGMGIIDLMHEGEHGLEKCIERFKVEKGFAFSTYAIHWIRQAITSAIADYSRTIRLPVHVHDEYRKVKRANTKYHNEFGIDASLEELVALTGFPRSKITELLVLPDCISLNKTLTGSNTEFGDLLSRDDHTYENFTRRKDVGRVLSTLDERERTVLCLRFGLPLPRSLSVYVLGKAFEGDPQGMTLEQIGNVLGCTRERIRQIERDALRRLRHPSRSRMLSDYDESTSNGSETL